MRNCEKSVLLITRYFPPLDASATSRMYSWAKYLDRAGFSVTVITTSKKGQVVNPFTMDVSKFNVWEIDYFDPIFFMGFDKKRTLQKMGGSRSHSFKKRSLQKLSKIYRERLNERMPGRTDHWILKAVNKMRELAKQGKKYYYIISSYGPPTAHIVGFFAKRIFNTKWLADYRDLWLEHQVYKGLWPFTLLEKRIERKIVSYSDMITCVSSNDGNTLRKKFPHIPVSIIENGYDPEEIPSCPGNFFSANGTKFRIVYTGSIYAGKRDPSPLFLAIRQLIVEKKLTESDIEILFYGGVTGNLEELIDRYEVSNVARHCGSFSKRDTINIQKSSNALLFLERPDPMFGEAPTAKIYEYLAIDKPIIAIGVPKDGKIGKLIEAAGAGVACECDVELIKSNLLQVMGNKVYRRNWKLIERFSRKEEVDRLISCLNGNVQSEVIF